MKNKLLKSCFSFLWGTLLVFCVVQQNVLSAGDSRILGEAPEVPDGYVIDNLARTNKGATASSQYPFAFEGKVMDSHHPKLAIDGDKESRWISFNKAGEHALVVDFGKEKTFFQINLCLDAKHGSFKDYVLQYYVNNDWKNIESIQKEAKDNIISHRFKEIKSSKVRHFVKEGMPDGYARLCEMEILGFDALPSPGEITNLNDFLLAMIDENKIDEKSRRIITDAQWYGVNSDADIQGIMSISEDKWQKIPIDASLTTAGFKMSYLWYRAKIFIPKELEDDDLALSLGKISLYDETYINKYLVGITGNPPPKKPTWGISFVVRRYLVPKKYIRFGETNDIYVKVYPGERGGMHMGPYYLISTKTFKKTAGTEYTLRAQNTLDNDALAHYLTKTTYLNSYREDESAKILFKIWNISDEKIKCTCNCRVTDESGKEVLSSSSKYLGTIDTNSHGDYNLIDLGKFPEGNYTVRLQYLSDNGKHVWEDELRFRVKDSKINLIPVDRELQAARFPERKYSLDKISHGHFGFLHENNIIQYTVKSNFSNGNGLLALSCLVNFGNRGPMLYRADLTSMPQNPLKPEQCYPRPWGTSGSIWSFGYITPSREATINSVDVEDVNWINVRYKLNYSDNSRLSVYENAIHPGFFVNTSSSEINLFCGINKYGLSQPNNMCYYSKDTVIRTTKSEPLTDMRKNWILVWFNGAPGWQCFDYPFLIVFQKKPRLIEQRDDAIAVSFKNSGGWVVILPLYGTVPIKPEMTKEWKTNIPLAIIKRCDELSALSRALPIACKEKFSINTNTDDVCIENTYAYTLINDEWNTKPRKAAYIPTSFSLAAMSGFPLSVSHPTVDAEYASLHGPLVYAPDTDRIVFCLKGIAKYINLHKMPDVSSFISAKSREYVNIINAYFDYLVKNKAMNADAIRMLCTQQNDLLRFTMGNYLEEMGRGMLYINSKETKEIVADTAKQIVAKYFFDKDYFVPIKDARRNIEIFMPAHDANMQGIDMAHWMGKYFLGLWAYAYYFNDTEIFKGKENMLEKCLFNLLVSHDFEIAMGWDSLFGLRMGSDMEDHICATYGLIAASRLYHLLGAEEMSEFLLYVSSKQLLGMLANEKVLSWVRDTIPVCNTTPQLESINITGTSFEKLGLEPNEQQGYYLFQIGQASAVNVTAEKKPHWGLIKLMYPQYALYPFARDCFPDVVKCQFDTYLPPDLSHEIPSDKIGNPGPLIRTIEYRHHILNESCEKLEKLYEPIKNKNCWWTVFITECLLEQEGKFYLQRLVY